MRGSVGRVAKCVEIGLPQLILLVFVSQVETDLHIVSSKFLNLSIRISFAFVLLVSLLF